MSLKIATQTKPIVRMTRQTFEGKPLRVTLNPDLTAELQIKGRPSTRLIVNLFDLYIVSRYADGRRGKSRKQFARDGDRIVVVPPIPEEPKRERRAATSHP